MNTNREITAAGLPGSCRIVHTGFARIGKKRNREKPLISEASQTEVVPVLGFCWRCKITHSHGWRTGPDGARTLCKDCIDLYHDCKLTLFRHRDGRISMIGDDGGKPVCTLGFRRTNPREHYMHPVVGPYVDGDGDDSGDTKDSVHVSSSGSTSCRSMGHLSESTAHHLVIWPKKIIGVIGTNSEFCLEGYRREGDEQLSQFANDCEKFVSSTLSICYAPQIEMRSKSRRGSSDHTCTPYSLAVDWLRNCNSACEYPRVVSN